jgi:hypothetical protein
MAIIGRDQQGGTEIMTQVQTMTNEHLNIALSKLMGRTEATAVMVNYGMITKYCEDPAASLEVQTAAWNADPIGYIRSFIDNTCGFESIISADTMIGIEIISVFISASPRERAEAAYITLSSKQ